MPILEQMDFQETCVVWEYTSNKNKYGEYIYSSPREIKCRWEYKTEERFDLKQVREDNYVAYDVRVYSSVIIPQRSILRYGLLADVDIEGLVEVVMDQRVPDIKSRFKRYRYFCMKHTKKLPITS